MRYPVAPVRLLFAVFLLAVSSSAFADWVKVTGSLSQVSVGSQVWGVNSADDIYYWTGSNWVHIVGKLRNIAVGADGTVWGANSANDVYARVNGQWTQMPGKVTQIAVGNASNIWAIGMADDVYRWNTSISNWERVDGTLTWIGVGADGSVWGNQRNGTTFRRDGNSWTHAPGALLANISVANATYIWGVTSGGEVYRWNGSTWVRIAGILKQASVSTNGAAFGVTNNGDIYYAAPGSVAEYVAPPPAYVAVGSGKSYLGVNQYIKTGEYLVSANKAFFATQQTDGNFCVYRGSEPSFNLGAVWCSQKVAGGGQFFAVQQTDGNFCVYAGTGPADNKGGVWCSHATAAGGGFSILQDDANFVTYKGTGPANNLGVLWNSATTANPTAPIPDERAYKIISTEKGFDGLGYRNYGIYGNLQRYGIRTEGWGYQAGLNFSANYFHDWFVPYPDMTIRPAIDPSFCLEAVFLHARMASMRDDGTRWVSNRPCQSPPTPAQRWQFDRLSRAAQQIRQGDRCLVFGWIYIEDGVVSGDPDYLTVKSCNTPLDTPTGIKPAGYKTWWLFWR